MIGDRARQFDLDGDDLASGVGEDKVDFVIPVSCSQVCDTCFSALCEDPNAESGERLEQPSKHDALLGSEWRATAVE